MTARRDAPIDRNLLREQIRLCEGDESSGMLERALDMLSDAQIDLVLDGFVSWYAVRSGLYTDLCAFDTQNRAAFVETAETRRELRRRALSSPRAHAWVAGCSRFFSRTVDASLAGAHQEAAAAFDHLLQMIDEMGISPLEDDEAARLFGLDVEVILPAYFRSLAMAGKADRYEVFARKGIERLAPHRMRTFLRVAAGVQRRSAHERGGVRDR